MSAEDRSKNPTAQPSKGQAKTSLKGKSGAQRAPKQESLIELFRKAELTEQLVFEIYAKLLVDGQRNDASRVTKTECVFRGHDLLAEEAARRQWLTALDSLTAEEVATVERSNPGWSQAYKVWKKTSKSMSKTRETLGLNMTLSVQEWVKVGKLTHFRATHAASPNEEKQDGQSTVGDALRL